MFRAREHNWGLEYLREIESMGLGLTLFKVQVKHKSVGQNYHYFYRDGQKPPFDVAINPDCGTVEYISFFLQDEKLDSNEMSFEINYADTGIAIEDSEFSFDMFHINKEAEFLNYIERDKIVVVFKGATDCLTGRMLDDSNYVLLSESGKIVGIVLKNISSDELKQIEAAGCL